MSRDDSQLRDRKQCPAEGKFYSEEAVARARYARPRAARCIGLPTRLGPRRPALAGSPYCSADPRKFGLQIRNRAVAWSLPYIQANPPSLRVWMIFDVDRAGAACLWEFVHLPEPTWTAMNPENGHAHLAWGLQVPVLVASPKMRLGPLRYLCAIEAAFREKLGADPGYSGFITKNPFHPAWRVRWATPSNQSGAALGYHLEELAEWVELPKYLPRKLPEIGVGRNATLFHFLRFYAYPKVLQFKESGSFEDWQSHLAGRALARNAEFSIPLEQQEVHHTIKSVSRWTWQRFNNGTTNNQDFRRRQAERGRKGGIASGESRRKNAINTQQPWKDEGMSRATWYRRNPPSKK